MLTFGGRTARDKHYCVALIVKNSEGYFNISFTAAFDLKPVQVWTVTIIYQIRRCAAVITTTLNYIRT